MSTYNPAKTYFISSATIDKILYESPVISGTYSGADPSAPAEHNFTVAHTLNRSVIANGMFSINGSDYYPCGLRIGGPPSGIVLGQQYLTCDMYADASNVHVAIDNGFDTAQSVSIYYALESLS